MTEAMPGPAHVCDKELLTQRYAEETVGTLGCWDRVIITGTLPDVCHAGAVEGWLRRDNLRCLDLKVFAEPLRDQVRGHALLSARAAGRGKETPGMPRDQANSTLLQHRAAGQAS